MGTLGDLLGDAQKGKIVGEHLNVGDVYRMPLTEEEGITPKNSGDDSRNKYFVIIGKDDVGNYIGFVVINSAINPKLPAHIKEYHYPIKSQKHPFLRKDSFVNCSAIMKIDKAKFSTLFTTNSHQGSIDPNDLECIIGAIRTNDNIPPKLLKQFGLL